MNPTHIITECCAENQRCVAKNLLVHHHQNCFRALFLRLFRSTHNAKFNTVAGKDIDENEKVCDTFDVKEDLFIEEEVATVLKGFKK